MFQPIIQIIGQKKGIAMMCGVLVAILGSNGIVIPEESLNAVLAPIVAYLLSQGAADFGKSSHMLDSSRRHT